MPRQKLSEDEKIKILQRELLTWYKKHGRHFPWRNKSITNYQAVIAEVLLQRTKAETVAKFYPQFIKDFPNWKSLADAPRKKIENYLKPIGLYRQRSKRVKSLAKEMVKRKGRLPRNREDLESIPFMGQYIANAVEVVIFNERSPLIDVNMARVLERFLGKRQMADIRYDPKLQSLAYKLVDHSKTKLINWAILDYAAAICMPQKKLCHGCMVNNSCLTGKKLFNQ